MRPRWLIAPALALALVIGAGCLAPASAPKEAAEPAGPAAPATPASEPAELPELPAAQPERGPLYGVEYPSNEPSGDVYRLDPRTLRPVRGVPRVDLDPTEYVAAITPDRTLAITADDGRTLRVIDLRTMRRLDSFRADRAVGWPLAGTWLRPDRLLLVAGVGRTLVATVIDPLDRRVVAQQVHELPAGQAFTTAKPVPGGIVVKLQPAAGVAAAGLAYVDGGGGVRWTTLHRIRAGSRSREEPSTATGTRQVEAGLAVDLTGNRLFVVSAGSPVAEVSLPELAVTYHGLNEPGRKSRSLLAWLGAGLSVPRAEAKEPVSGPVRQAEWLGSGYLAVWGEDSEVRSAEGGMDQRSRAYGVRLIDTRTWTIRTLVPNASQGRLAGDRFIVFGGSYQVSAEGLNGINAPGLRILTPGGGRTISVFEGRHLTWVETYGKYAYVYLDSVDPAGRDGGYSVVDIRTGKVVGTERGRQLPVLLR